MKNYFNKTSQDLFFSRKDIEDPRLGDIATSADLGDLKKGDIVILGYPDDEGVKNSEGRIGAAQAPNEIRRVLYKMTPSSKLKAKILDLGNLQNFGNLPSRHVAAREAVHQILNAKARPITLGGGHDYALPDLAAFCSWAKENKKNPVVINFDAHLDVRPRRHGEINSGCAFRDLLIEFPGLNLHLVGIQDWCNSQVHRKWAKDNGANIISLNEILLNKQGLTKIIQDRTLKKLNPKRDVLAVSIDLDAFSTSEAPGVSQGFPSGLKSNSFIPAFDLIFQNIQPSIVGLYETNPVYDIDLRTVKLAAIMVHKAIFS